MPSATYPLRALVLRKTKLKESDLIVTLLAEDGRQVRAVAKGARKPTSPFSSRLEIFSEVDLLLACGKSLDVVKEARLVNAYRGLTCDMEHAAAAAPMADLASRLCQPGLESPKLFALSSSAFLHAQACDAQGALAVCSAYMLKAFSFAGFRPSLRTCASCGTPVLLDGTASDRASFSSRALSSGRIPSSDRAPIAFSAAEGGVVCPACLLFADTVRVPAEVLAWADALLMSTFDDIAERPPAVRISFEVLHLCQSWVREHVGTRLKSLEFLFTCGLF